MKNLLKYKAIFTFIHILFSTCLMAQLISDTHIPNNYNCTTCNLKSVTFHSSKTVRVNIHYISRSNGTGNFSETCNILGNTSNENGYWHANYIINEANHYLANNLEMTQQLSYNPIPVEDINYSYKLNGVFFHRSDTYFECYCLPYPLIRNNGAAINVFLFANNAGHGSAYNYDCWLGGMYSSYSSYVDSTNIWYISIRAKPLNHEIGHILSLDHPKMSPNGAKSVLGGTQYTDNCDDTPTFMELINDGYTDPYEWCNGRATNNLMDYNCNQRALTPCQINQVHSYIENDFAEYQYGHYQNSYSQITSFSDNMAYIAETVEIPANYSIIIPNNKRLYIEAHEFIVNGEFEVPIGSCFEFTPSGI